MNPLSYLTYKSNKKEEKSSFPTASFSFLDFWEWKGSYGTYLCIGKQMHEPWLYRDERIAFVNKRNFQNLSWILIILFLNFF